METIINAPYVPGDDTRHHMMEYMRAFESDLKNMKCKRKPQKKKSKRKIKDGEDSRKAA
jgi:hypothetical protein